MVHLYHNAAFFARLRQLARRWRRFRLPLPCSMTNACSSRRPDPGAPAYRPAAAVAELTALPDLLRRIPNSLQVYADLYQQRHGETPCPH